jgi:methylphosphotriester-DNA--protein-cysteine methyltransferase
MPTIANRAIGSQFLFKNKIIKFTKQFEAEQSPKKRIQRIEKLMIKKILAIQPQTNIIECALHKMNESCGCSSISSIVNQLGVSERYFQKNFKKMVGITAAVYNRIVRFNFMFAEMKSEVPIDYKSLAALFKYYDFPHFSKDFKKYCGACPSKFYIHKFELLQQLMTSKASLMER